MPEHPFYTVAHHREGPQTRNYAFGNPDTEDTENGIEGMSFRESKTASVASVPLW
jgi:hypothetical protein